RVGPAGAARERRPRRGVGREREQGAEALASPAPGAGMGFPATRLRRLRRSDRLRALVRETRLDLDDFVFPLFVGPRTEPNADLPPFGRLAVEDLPTEAAELERLG